MATAAQEEAGSLISASSGARETPGLSHTAFLPPRSAPVPSSSFQFLLAGNGLAKLSLRPLHLGVRWGRDGTPEVHRGGSRWKHSFGLQLGVGGGEAEGGWHPLHSLLSCVSGKVLLPEPARPQEEGTIFRLLVERNQTPGTELAFRRGAALFILTLSLPFSPPPPTLRRREPRRSTGEGRTQGHLANQGRAETPASRPFRGLRRWVRPHVGPGAARDSSYSVPL